MNDYLKTNPSLDEITQKEINAKISQPDPGQKKKKHILGKILIGASAILATPFAIAGYVGKKTLRHINYKEYKSKDNNKPRTTIGKLVTAGKVGLISLAICYPGTTVKTFRNGKNYVINQAGKIWNQITTPPDYKKEAEQVKEEAKQIEKKYNEEQKRVKKLEQKLEAETGLKWEYKGKYEAATSKPSKANAKPAYNPKGEEQALNPNISKTGPASYNSVDNKVYGVFIQRKGTTLSQVAKEHTGDFSNWKQLADYNNINAEGTKKIKLGDLIFVPESYTSSKSLKSFEKGKEPRNSFVREQGETLEQAMQRYSIGLNQMDEIITYNRQLMPSIKLGEQERFWVPPSLHK